MPPPPSAPDNSLGLSGTGPASKPKPKRTKKTPDSSTKADTWGPESSVTDTQNDTRGDTGGSPDANIRDSNSNEWGPAGGEISENKESTEWVMPGDNKEPGGNDWGTPAANDDWGAPAATTDDWGVPAATADDWGTGAAKLTEDDGDLGVTGEEDSKESGKGKGKGPREPRVKRPKPYVPAVPQPRTKMTEDELAERMKEIRLKNEKIRERQKHVKADEEAFNSAMAAERAKREAKKAESDRVQARINQAREANAKKKMERMSNREWDAEKKGRGFNPGQREWDKGKGEGGIEFGDEPPQEPKRGKGKSSKPKNPGETGAAVGVSDRNEATDADADTSTKKDANEDLWGPPPEPVAIKSNLLEPELAEDTQAQTGEAN